MIDKINELVGKCSGSVVVSFNKHKDYDNCKTQDLIDERTCECSGGFEPKVSGETKKVMDKTNTTIEILFRPFKWSFEKDNFNYFVVYHYDLDKALDEALNYVK